MGTNCIRIGLLIIVTQFLSSAGCKKAACPFSTSAAYSFTVTSEWQQQKEIYTVGDTLHLISTFPKTLTDQINTSMVIDYSNAKGIGGDITTFLLDSISHQPVPARDSFQLLPVVGNLVERDRLRNEGINIEYFEANTYYQFKCAIICREKGLYAFFISDLLSNGIRNKECTKAGFANKLTNTNKNINLFEYAIGRPPASQYEIDKIYCFRVE